MSGEIGNGATPARLFVVVREKMRTRHMAYRTEQAYLQWIRRFIAYHRRRHPRDLGGPDIEQFLTHLAVDRKVSASTQNQALQAILFLYRHVLAVDLPWLENVTRASRPVATRCVTASPRISSRTATTSARSRSCSATRT